MKIIGVTGSSGSGKSTLSKLLNEKKDVSIIDADNVVRQMSIPGTEYLNAIKKTFGNEILLKNGELNRRVLANKIYNDNKSRDALNSLTFKYVVCEILERIKKNKDKRVKISVIDAPLLFESGLYKYCDLVIALIADKKLKIKRICQRDKIDEKTAESRLNIQKDDSYYIERADFVITNNENCDLKKEINKIIERVKNESIRF